MTDRVNNIVSSSVTGASSLLSLQLFSRIITFAINNLMIRFVSTEILGAASIDLELILSTILFLSREGFRCALLRADLGQLDSNARQGTRNLNPSTQKLLNLSYLPIPIGFTLASLMITIYLFNPSEQNNEIPFYYSAALLYLIAAIIELISEPFYILASSQLNFKLRVRIEGLAVFFRTLCVFLINLFLSTFLGENGPKYSILSFGVAQLLYSLIVLSGYLRHYVFQPNVPSFFPKKIQESGLSIGSYVDPSLLSLSVTLSLQSFVKHLLTEGDKILFAFLSQAEEKGFYSIAFNYGSLVARILFLPLEESGRALFSKLLKIEEGEQDDDNSRLNSIETASQILITILKFHILFGMIFLFFVPHYAATLFSLINGRLAHTDAPNILSVYCLYIPIMGINGITEAFVQAVASPKELSRLSYSMVLFFFVFLVSGYTLIEFLLASYAIIIANCINMLLRIGWSLNFVIEYFNRQSASRNQIFKLRKALPSIRVVLSFIISSYFCHMSENNIGYGTLIQKLLHICVGGLCFSTTCFVIYLNEKEFISTLIRLTKRQPPVKSD